MTECYILLCNEHENSKNCSKEFNYSFNRNFRDYNYLNPFSEIDLPYCCIHLESMVRDKFLKRYIGDLMLFSWVQCLRTNLPAVSVEKAILNFMKHSKIETFNLDRERGTYYRMEEEYRELQKSNT